MTRCHWQPCVRTVSRQQHAHHLPSPPRQLQPMHTREEFARGHGLRFRLRLSILSAPGDTAPPRGAPVPNAPPQTRRQRRELRAAAVERHPTGARAIAPLLQRAGTVAHQRAHQLHAGGGRHRALDQTRGKQHEGRHALLLRTDQAQALAVEGGAARELQLQRRTERARRTRHVARARLLAREA